jgi:hypothetical protein
MRPCLPVSPAPVEKYRFSWMAVQPRNAEKRCCVGVVPEPGESGLFIMIDRVLIENRAAIR